MLPTVATAEEPSIDQQVQMIRSLTEAQRQATMAANVVLTEEEGAKFWPLYEKYQAEQNTMVDAQLKGVKDYVDNYNKLDDAKAMAFIEVQMKRDEAMVALRRKWLSEFQKIVPTTTAVRVIQIDRRLSQALQVVLSSQLPLVR